MKIKCAVPPKENFDRIKEDQIGLYSAKYQELFGVSFRQGHKSKPDKRGIVKVKAVSDTSSSIVYLKFLGASALGASNDKALVHPRTMDRLGFDLENGGVIEIERTAPYWGRFLFYWSHPEDSLRAAFKLGCLGVVLGLLSLL